jgi:hypothetical protein
MVANKPCPAGFLRSPGRNGECVCAGFAFQVDNSCMQAAVLVPSVVGPVLVLLLLAAYIFERRRTRKAREAWTIHHDRLLFDEPRTVRAHFGSPICRVTVGPARDICTLQGLMICAM